MHATSEIAALCSCLEGVAWCSHVRMEWNYSFPSVCLCIVCWACASSRLAKAFSELLHNRHCLTRSFPFGYKSRWFIPPLFSGTYYYYWLVGCAPSKIACDLSDTEASTIHCARATCTLPRLSRRYVEYIFHRWNSLLCCECVEYCERQNSGVRRPG